MEDLGHPPRDREKTMENLVPGTELGWGIQALGPQPQQNIYDQYKYVVFKDEKWDWKTFDFDAELMGKVAAALRNGTGAAQDDGGGDDG